MLACAQDLFRKPEETPSSNSSRRNSHTNHGEPYPGFFQKHFVADKRSRHYHRKENGFQKDKEEQVWPPDVEAAFIEALETIPKLGRRKILVNGKPCGK
ncbi:hypothetical protein EC973_001621 [Apophysomyces ossiformis]|uniref:TEA domain-containing protein n=1 Tax=Apophysomyces ossiformis TaxID=679940 RepID=A0A8H7BU86_9FUNG|nr:hypothetical protein EC973_001621 [Apophysomyces ossiformis]